MKQNLLFNQLTAMPKRLAMVLTVLFTLGVGSMLGAEEIVYTLTPAKGSNSTYTGNCDIDISDITWNLAGNSQMIPWRIGGKSFTNVDRALYSKNAMSNDISKIVITHGTASNITVNSMKVIVSTNSNGGGTILSTLTPTFKASGDVTVTRPSGVSWKNAYYKIVYNVTVSGSSNKFIEFEEAKFYAETAPAVSYTVNWHVNGTIEHTQIDVAGKTLNNIPDLKNYECGGKVFVGWITQSSYEHATDAPTGMITNTSGMTMPEGGEDYYAVFAESGGTGSTSWEKTDISGISSSDVIVITMSKSEVTYAMMNNGGTSSPPGAEKITINGNTIESTVYDTYKWNISNSSGNLTIYPNGTTTTWLYCTATNNGVRVGTNTNKTFTISGNYLQHTATSRYVGVYVANPDWRCYTSTTGNSNIAGQTLAFYKKTTTGGYQNYTTECSIPTEFTVSFDANGHGTAPTQQTVTSGGYAQEPNDDPSETGYNFQGWYNNSSCTGEPFDFENTPITDDITLYAKWTAIQTTITLNANGGSGNTTSVAATYDSSTLNPSSITNPTKTGHTFGGWYSGEGGTGSLVINSSGKLQANVSGFTGTNGVWKATTNKTLYAKWTPAVYAINYKDQGDVAFSGTHAEGHPTTHTYNTETTLKSASKDHYTFGGWYKESNCSGTAVTTLGATEYTENITLYAKWTAKTYTITLDANGGTFVDKRDSQTKGSATFDYIYGTYANYNDAPNLTEYYSDLKRDGYQFDKWVSAGSPWNKLFTSTGDRTIQAQWSKLYTITLSENGTPTEPTTQTSTTYKLPAKLTAGSCLDDTKDLVGWSKVAIPTPGDKPTSDYYELGATAPLTTDQTTFYAVFATPKTIPGGTEEKEETTTLNFSAQGYGNEEEVTSLTIDDVTVAFNKGTNSNVPKYYNTGTAVRVYGGGYFTVSVPSECTISTIALTFGSGDGSNTITTNSDTYSNGTWTGSAQSVKFTIGGTTGHRRIKSIAVTYTTTVQADDIISFSDYTTTCVKLPDPVWNGADIDKTALTVNCGERSPMDGAAKITFSKDKIYNFSSDITITASEGFLVSTSRTPNENYKQYVSQSPLVGTDYPNTFNNKFVYVRAEAPAMSEEDLSGTITIKNSTGETLQTFSVTADVTCTTYTLTLNDRGTKTTAEYYAGASVPKPADPEGVCTDPINYVFDGWSLDPVTDENTTSYEKVTFPFDMPAGKTTLYAVYRYVEDGGADSGDYVKVTENLDDYSGDYLIVYEAGSLALNGALVGDGLDASGNSISVTITDNTIVATDEVNASNFTIAKEDDGYSIRSASGYYIGQTTNGNDLKTNSTKYYANTITLTNDDNVNIVSGGAYLRYNANSGNTNLRFRYYNSENYTDQKAIALYKKAASYLYTTSPVCGPHLAITEGKDIYVTGGNAGGTRDLVIAQQKVSYKATRLQTSNGLADGTAPDVKVATNGITVGGVVTSDVKVTIDQTKEQQTDGTYTITGTITVQYQPSANNKQEDIQVQLAVDYNTDAKDNFTVHARSLPAEFVIVAKSNDKWYALNGDMNTNAANPANGQVTLDNDANPTKATYAPCNTIYTFDGLPNTGDRTYVRFQGTDGAWLWAASGTNVGIQNNVLKTTPEGSNKAYNWKLYTEDNITYRFGNANSSRQLTLNGEKFGMYASGVQDIRILPYVEKCLYNYAPSNLKVSVLKGTYVTLTWDAVAGAIKYQYSTNGTTWTDCGTEPTVTINDLEGATKYTYYIRAYHEDAGVSHECIDYAEITFTTADCDDVPTDISFAAGIYSITLYWQCAAEASTVILYSDEAGTQAIKTITDAKSPLTIDDLDKVTTYYAKILAGGICASPLTTVSTAPPAVDVVEWKTNGMDVYVNTDDEIIVSLEGEVYEGSGSGNVATELFFSKYFEATGNVKLLALFNGTGQDIDLSTYSIKFSAKGADYTGATTTEEVKYDNTIELSEDIPDDRLILPAGKELIMISYPTSGAAGAVSITNPDGTTIKIDSKDAAILECAANNSQESGWDDYVRVTSPLLNFSGNDAVALFKGDQLVDIIGAGNTTNVNMSKVVAASTNPSFMDAAGWYNANGYQIQPDGTIGTTNNYPLSTNRCLLIRRNTVINGDNAVLKNTTDFVTLGGQESEWMGYQIPDGNGACEGFEYVGKYDYANYYTTYDKVGEDQTFESGSRNPDGTVPVSIPEIGKYSCKNLKITVKDEEQVLVVQEFKVPIIVAKNQNTDGEVFTALKTTLGTVVIDQNGTPTGEIEPLTDEEWIEECKECDIVVRDNATLTHVTTGLDQFRDLTIYPTGKLSNIESNLAVNRLMIQAENDQVGYAIIEKGEGSITANAIAHTKRIDAQYWYAFSLPYDCNINEITQANGESMGEYGVHWGIQYYDGKRRQYEGTSANLGQSSKFWLPMGPNDKLNAYQGYLIALFDASVQKPTDMRTIYFPPAEENTYTESGSDSKQTNVYSWNVNLTCEKRHHGWNFTGTPYISMFNPVAAGITDADLSNVLMTGTWDPVENEYEENEHVYVSIPTPNGGKYYNQHLASTKELLPFMAYFVQTSDPTTGDETKQLTYAKGGRELPAAAPARAAATAQRVLVELLVTAPDGQTDNTGVWVDENYVPEYELAADLTKMYVAGEKPQLYTLAANNEKMAYNALPDGAATNIPLGLYAPIAGDYNLSLNERMSRIAGAESVELIYNNAVVANLLFQDYTITAKKGNVNGYSLCIRRRANVTTAVDNVTGSVITMIVNDGYISVLGVPTDATVYVYDMVGHLMEMQSANGNTVVNMPSVPQGVYNIVITNDKGSTTIKSFVK